MFEALFGSEMPLALRFFVAFVVVLALIGGAAYLVRRFGAVALHSGARGRQHRLGVIESTSVDARRRLLLIRRDNTEHLLLIGGPTDVVVEPNIVRAAAAPARETQAPRVPEILPRTVPSPESGMWQTPEVSVRIQRPAPPPPDETVWPAQVAEPPIRVSAERIQPERPHAERIQAERAPVERPQPERPQPERIQAERLQPERPQPERIQAERHAERFAQAAQAAEAVRMPTLTEPAARAPESRRTIVRSDAEGDENLAEMARRLESTLRRQGGDAAEPPPKPVAAPAPAQSALPKAADLARQPAPRSGNNSDGAHPPADAKPAAPAKPTGKAVYENLEQEMASLLGRPTGKS